MTERSELAVIAFNVNGQGGIGDKWQTGGLNSSIDVQCTITRPNQCQGPDCSTLWLESPECENAGHFSERNIQITVSEISPAVVVLEVVVQPSGVPEHEYQFVLHLPVLYGGAWRFETIPVTFSVSAVASPLLSVVTVCQELSSGDSSCLQTSDGREAERLVVDHQQSLSAGIAVRDIDGYPIEREGEQITVTVQHVDGTTQADFLASFNSASGLYETAVKNPRRLQCFDRAILTSNKKNPQVRKFVNCPIGDYVVGLRAGDSSNND